MTTRETRAEKALRYLADGRLTVFRVDGIVIEAECAGDSGTYRLGRDPGGWWCGCPARRECAHLVAVKLVTVRRPAVERAA